MRMQSGADDIASSAPILFLALFKKDQDGALWTAVIY